MEKGLDLTLAFASDAFDFTSELPPAHNAGNRFYGQDVAAYLAQHLTDAGLPAVFFDEDWGWLVEGAVGEVSFEVAVYNLAQQDAPPSKGEASGGPEWRLWVRAFRRRKVWGLFSRREQVAVPAHVHAVLVAALREKGATELPAD